MEGTEDSGTVASTPVSEMASGLRLRPVKARREMEQSDLAESDVPKKVDLEEIWDDEPMTPAGRVLSEMHSMLAVICILGFKHPIDASKFKSQVELTLMKHKRFSSRVETRKGIPWWTQVTTNVDNHVFEVEFPPDQKEDKDCVLNYTTDVLLHKPFDRSKPLWDVHLVEAKLGDAEGCAILRIHHSLGDGTSLMSLLMASSRSVHEPDLLPSLTTESEDKRNGSPPAASASFVSRILSALRKFLLVFWYSFTEIAKVTATSLWMKDSPTVISGYPGVENLPKKYRFATVRLEEMKSVSKATNSTINDVFTAMAAYGLRQYLQHHAEKDIQTGELQEMIDTTQKEFHDRRKPGEGRPDGSTKKLDSLRIRAVAMLNMRASPGLQELSEMMKGQASQARWGNLMAYLVSSLPMKRYSDPLELLRHVRAIGIRKKLSLEGSFSYAAGILLITLCGQKAAAAAVARVTLQTTLSLSNVKGPTDSVMFAENPIVHILPSVVGHPHSMVLHLQSYNGEITLVAMVTEKLIPDPEYFLELCLEGLQEFKKATMKEK